MRTTQLYGLHSDAFAFLNANVRMIPNLTCPKCGEVISYTPCKEVYKSAASAGMFDDGPELMEYTLNDGRVIQEVVQAVPWSSGPCIFLCLREKGKQEFLFPWPEDIVNNA